ncbi:hypothetical protein OUZ56_001633 [Daphnia magna]|uniref:Uncharacterized protein n=1 Tax=Daphnia magna TaxID=35525 RepID=A0ABR0A3Q3_9CRUS|nr:hypothetical protein OUZ56_001633 [Daphnia magna]
MKKKRERRGADALGNWEDICLLAHTRRMPLGSAHGLRQCQRVTLLKVANRSKTSGKFEQLEKFGPLSPRN